MTPENPAKAKAAKSTRKSAPAPENPALLTVEPGYGFTAVIHEGVLQVQQGNAAGTDTLMLSRSEARRLFEEFEEWANA